MKAINLIALFTLIMTMISFQGITQDKEPETVIIRVCEFSINVKSQILVIEPDGNVTKLLLEKVTSNNYEESMVNNAIVLQKEINKWRKQGFIISGMTSNMESGNRYQLIIMTKENE